MSRPHRPDHRNRPDRPDRPDRFEAFRALHDADTPLFLPNAWDHASAIALVERGFPAVGTTSLGVAIAAGRPDGLGETREETLRLAAGLARLPVPISVDIERGFGERPQDVAALGVELVGLGVAGVNLEDGRADGTLVPIERQVEVIAALKEAAPTLFVNARTDTYWVGGRGGPALAEAVRRVRAYRSAGGDGVFVPGVGDPEAIAALVAATDAPLNVLYAPDGLSLARLAALGVRRVSTGSLLFRAAVSGAADLAWAIARGVPAGEAAGPLSTYAQAQAWAEAYRDR